MRIVCTADTHFGSSSHLGRINPSTGLHTRLEDFLRNFDTIVDYVIDNEIDLFVIAGDIYKTRSPTNTEQEEFAKRISRLGKAKQRTLIITGNHDMWASRGSAHTIAVINALRPQNVEIVDTPRLVEYNGIKIGAIPYLYRQRLGMKTNEEVIQHYATTCKCFVDQGATLLFGHQTIDGAKMPTGYAAQEKMNEIVVPQSCFVGFEFCAFGHIHEYQILSKSPLMLYTGPLERLDFSQSDKPTGFVVYDTETKEYKYEKLESADLYYVKLDLTQKEGDPTQVILDTLDEKRLANSIVTIAVKIRETDVVKLNRSKIDKLLSTSRFNAGLRLDIQRSVTSRDLQVNETMSAKDALQRYIRGREDLKDIAEDLIEKGLDIIRVHEGD